LRKKQYSIYKQKSIFCQTKIKPKGFISRAMGERAMTKKQGIKATALENISFLAGEKRWGRIASFARNVGISTKNARDILEKGVMPQIETLQKIASTYNTTIDSLLQPRQKKIKPDPVLLELVLLQKKCLEVAKKDPLFKQNHVEDQKLHLEFNRKGLESQATLVIEALFAISAKI
jgi:transcriptional regulator with XRE-family HTH domain